jgi:hypothetical protein
LAFQALLIAIDPEKSSTIRLRDIPRAQTSHYAKSPQC